MQTAFDLRTVDEHIEVVYEALRKAVKQYDVKQGSFADDMGKPGGDVSQRLGRKVHKGELQRAHVDWIGFLATKPHARAVFLRELAQAWGYKLEPLCPPDAEEMVRALAADLTDKRKRQIEREQGWPEGWLDR